MMAARVASQRGRRVLLIDHADEPGKKILISGGGRCNFTNMATVAERFISANPHFAKSALGRYSPQDFLALVEAHNIAWHEKTLGQLFCDGSARQIVAMLVDECATIDWALGHPIRAVEHGDGVFRVVHGNRTSHAPALVIATGGPAIPKMGATGFAYDLARQFGLKLVEPRPALVPFTLGAGDALFQALSGVATEVVATCGKARFREAALFTHRGLSGPAMLQVSSYWRHGEPVSVDFVPGAPRDWLVSAKRTRPRASLRAALAGEMPVRLADTLAQRLPHANALGGVTDRELNEIAAKLAAWRFMPNGTEGFAKAEVTVGGVSTADLSSQTMGARRVPGLYAIGEGVDVTGWLGGYNFQWAWASGVAAGNAL